MWSLCELFPLPSLIHVVDVGAAVGSRPPYQDLVDAGRARITGFEPDIAACERLTRRYGAPHTFHPCFIGSGEEGTFHETNWNLTGSLFEPNTPLLSKFQYLAELTTLVEKHRVSTTALDAIAGLEDVDFMKLDVQGAECDVLRAGPKRLAEAVIVQVEVEFVALYKNQPLFADVDAILRGAGFQFHTFLGFGCRAFRPLMKNNDPKAGFRQALWSDAVYVRDWMQLEALSDQRLLKLAVLLHDVFASFDLSYVMLAELDRRDGGARCAQYGERLSHGA